MLSSILFVVSTISLRKHRERLGESNHKVKCEGFHPFEKKRSRIEIMNHTVHQGQGSGDFKHETGGRPKGFRGKHSRESGYII